MTDEERIARLDAELIGTDAQVIGAFQVWALDAKLTDHHLQRISMWADLDLLMVAGCPITDAGMASICRFRRLKSLDIGGTLITAKGIATADLPTTLTDIGLCDISMTDIAANRIAQLPGIRMLNCNGCGLSVEAFEKLAGLAKLWGFEALDCPVPDDVARGISQRKPNGLLRLDSGVWRNGVVTRPPENMS